MIFDILCQSCHFNRASNDEFSVEFWMFVLIFFPANIKVRCKEVQFTQNYLFWVKTPLLYLESDPNFKTRPWLKNKKYSKFDTKFIIWHPVKMTWHKTIKKANLSCIVLETTQEQFLCGGNTTTLPPPPKMRKFLTNKRTVDICKHKSVRQDLDKIPMGRITAQFQVEFSHLPFANWVNFVKAMCDM